MRACAKMRCEGIAIASVGLRYAEKVVVMGDLPDLPDRNLLELCAIHTERMTPPFGWGLLDLRRVSPISDEVVRDLSA